MTYAMSLDSFRSFLDNASAPLAEAPERVQALLDELASTDAGGYAPLTARLHRFLEGPRDEDSWEQLVFEWPALERRVALERLKASFLVLAANLPDGEWETEVYWDINDAIALHKDGDSPALFEAAGALRANLDSTWARYLESSESDTSELEPEVELTHQILDECRGLFGEALDELERAARGEGSFATALREAETASRRLMCVQAIHTDFDAFERA